jgi:hypothetical protein
LHALRLSVFARGLADKTLLLGSLYYTSNLY